MAFSFGVEMLNMTMMKSMKKKQRTVRLNEPVLKQVDERGTFPTEYDDQTH
jgi:hypothetical protein